MEQNKAMALALSAELIACDFREVLAPHCARSFLDETECLREIAVELRRLAPMEEALERAKAAATAWHIG